MTSYELRISDWSSDVCSSDLGPETTTSAAAYAGLFESMPFKDYFDGTSRLEHDYLTAITSNLGNAADWENVRQTNGMTDKPEVSPQSVYDMSEELQIGRASWRERVIQYVKVAVGGVA